MDKTNSIDNISVIAEIEKVKSALTEAQKNLEDKKYKDAADCVFGSKLLLEPISKKVRHLFENS